jgi:Cu/Ag efflux pump CusA
VLSAIVRFSLRFRGIVIALSCALLGYGVYSLTQSRYDVFPEFAPPEAVIQTEAPGMAPEQVELLVAQHIENTINGVPGITALRSGSVQGLSVITVIFDPRSDIYRDRQVVAERLSTITGELPAGVKPPVLTPLTSSTSVVLAVGLTSKTQPLMTIRTVADWTLQPSLLAVPGVSKISIFGGESKEIQIQPDPEQLARHNLSIEDLVAAAQRATGIRGAGFIDTPNQRIALQPEGQLSTSAQIARAVLLHQNGANVTLGDVARVEDAPEPPISARRP